MTPQWAAVVISVLALLFSIYNGNKVSGKDDRKEAEEVGKRGVYVYGYLNVGALEKERPYYNNR